ncbi:apoptosis regulator BAX-like isoform X2 [Alosa sapidissima]|uniref:apoptosis regulator BAX-like isoform X2 n=1 Tax=Alosa sapidissima TaxID=34773 RepID=UPI001C0A2ABF|nr:apoptosis regulator BAX-like isoform X2 [Alosa sapidissima]
MTTGGNPEQYFHRNMAELPGEGDAGKPTGSAGKATDNVLEVGTDLLKEFIYERVRRHGDPEASVTRSELGGRELCDPNHKRLAQCLQQIGDELDSNTQLQSMINDSALKPTKDVFVKVACEIFSDGKFNWGRVVALFYFACRLVIKALLTRVPDIIRTIITWTIDYLQDHVINWIREQGGWDGIRSHFGTPTWQTVGVFLAGVLTTVLVIRKL